MIRDCGSVKLRCAFGFGTAAATASATRWAVVSSPSPRAAALFRASCSARSRASSSSACFASRILASRDSRRRSSCGSSSPRESLPNRTSSLWSIASACASNSDTSSARIFSFSLIRA